MRDLPDTRNLVQPSRPLREELEEAGLINPQLKIKGAPLDKLHRKTARRLNMRERDTVLGLFRDNLERIGDECKYAEGWDDERVLNLTNAAHSDRVHEGGIIPITAIRYIRKEVYGELVTPPKPADSSNAARLDRVERALRFIAKTTGDKLVVDRVDEILNGEA